MPEDGRGLLEVAVRNHVPITGGKGKVIERKEALRDLIKKEIGESKLEEARRSFRGKKTALEIVFSLFAYSSEEGRRKKDLDNLLKLVLGVLPEYMVARGTANSIRGVGFIADERTATRATIVIIILRLGIVD